MSGDRLGKFLKSLPTLFRMNFPVGVQDSLGNKGLLKYNNIRPMEEERLCYAKVSDVIESGTQYGCCLFGWFFSKMLLYCFICVQVL